MVVAKVNGSLIGTDLETGKNIVAHLECLNEDMIRAQAISPKDWDKVAGSFRVDWSKNIYTCPCGGSSAKYQEQDLKDGGLPAKALETLSIGEMDLLVDSKIVDELCLYVLPGKFRNKKAVIISVEVSDGLPTQYLPVTSKVQGEFKMLYILLTAECDNIEL